MNGSRPNVLARKGDVVRNGLRRRSTRSADVGAPEDDRSEYLASRAWRRTDWREPRLTMTHAPPSTAQNTTTATMSSRLITGPSSADRASNAIQCGDSLGSWRLPGNVARFGRGEQ